MDSVYSAILFMIAGGHGIEAKFHPVPVRFLGWQPMLSLCVEPQHDQQCRPSIGSKCHTPSQM